MLYIIITSNFYIGLFFVFFIAIFGNYFLIREIIWSIVWCDKGGKYNSLKKLKENRNIFERLTMKYLEQYTNVHKKEFTFWLKVKLIFVISQIILLAIFILCGLLLKDFYCKAIRIIIVVQALIIFIILWFQTDTNRSTKYDRIRINKRHKK